MLCEGAVRFMQQATEAIRDQDAQTRYDKLSRTGEIILALKNALDLSGGDPVAQELDSLYHALDGRILALHYSNDLAECAAVLAELRSLRDAWDAIACAQVAGN